MSHSKRNTTRPVFTAHERTLAKSSWTASSARLNRDSFLPFGSCCLCLITARDPVTCHRGDLFCRECALANILAQKKELKRAEKLRKAAVEDTARNKAAQDEEDQERAVKDFELTQAGLSASKQLQKKESGPVEVVRNANGVRLIEAGAKRKFTLDDEDVDRIAQEDRSKARKAIDDEKTSKETLPSFWTPSLTPSTDPKLALVSKPPKTHATCPASSDNNSHTISLQKLTTVHFNEEDKQRTCPSCRKKLSNSSNAVMATKCGHVLCMSCVKQFMLPPKKEKLKEDTPVMCFVCDMPAAVVLADTESDKLPAGLVALKSEGTGFSAKGGSTVQKTSVGFQC